MPGRTRLFSEFLAEDSESGSNASSIGSYNNRLSSTQHLSAHLQATRSILPEFSTSPKRRKTLGLNSRFDRMIARTNLNAASQTLPVAERHKRARTRSSGSSSASSYDIPKTPVDAYEGLEEGRLGQTFSVLKMKGGNKGHLSAYYRAGVIEDENDISQWENRSEQIPVNSQREPLPEWLSNTLSHLPRNDPLRILLPPSPQHSSNNTLSDPTEDVPLFAFSQSPDQNLVVQGEHTEETVASNPIGSLHSAYIDYQPNRQGHYSANEHTQPTGLPSPMHPFEKTVNDSELRTFLSDAPALASAMKFDPMLIQSPDLLPLPFSTPGPSSNISFNHPYQPTVTTIPVLPDDIAPNELDGVTAGSPSSILDSFSDLIATEPCVPLSNPSVSTILAPAPRFAFAVDISPSPPLIDEPVLDPIEFDNSLVSTSSPSCMPEIRNLYSTPGPRFEAITSKRIYFDSPTEDPSDSDPFEPTEGYEIEPEELDFKWEPFIRKEIPGYDGGSIAGSISTADQWDYSVEFKYEDFERDSDLDVHAYPTPERISFDGQALPTDTNYTTGKSTAVQSYNDESEKAREVFTPAYTPKTNKAETAFAPAPGVFISPLRNAPESPEQESTSQIQSKPHILYLRETEISQVPIPVTPRNRSNTPPILSGSGKNEELHSKRYLTPTLSRSRPTQRWQLTQESPEVANVFKERQNGMRDNSMKPMKPASFSQLSNDSIESWN